MIRYAGTTFGSYWVGLPFLTGSLAVFAKNACCILFSSVSHATSDVCMDTFGSSHGFAQYEAPVPLLHWQGRTITRTRQGQEQTSTEILHNITPGEPSDQGGASTPLTARPVDYGPADVVCSTVHAFLPSFLLVIILCKLLRSLTWAYLKVMCCSCWPCRGGKDVRCHLAAPG